MEVFSGNKASLEESAVSGRGAVLEMDVASVITAASDGVAASGNVAFLTGCASSAIGATLETGVNTNSNAVSGKNAVLARKITLQESAALV